MQLSGASLSYRVGLRPQTRVSQCTILSGLFQCSPPAILPFFRCGVELTGRGVGQDTAEAGEWAKSSGDGSLEQSGQGDVTDHLDLALVSQASM